MGSSDGNAALRTAFGDVPFSWVCASRSGECLGMMGASNGTGTLSSTDNSATIRLFNGSEFAAVVNDTVNCGPIVLTSVRPVPSKPPASWTRNGPPAPRRWNTNVDAATFLGRGSTPGADQTIAVAVDILPSGHVVVATNGQYKLGNKVAEPLLPGSNASSNGTLVVLDVPHNAGAAQIDSTAPTVIARYALGDRVDFVRCNSKGDCAVAGSFGIAVIELGTGTGGGLGSVGSVPSIRWQDPLTDVRPSQCGVCCYSTGWVTRDNPPNCRVDIDDDGVVGASLGGQGGSFLWAIFEAETGRRSATGEENEASLTDVQLQPEQKRMLVTAFHDANTGHEPMVMASMIGYSYEGGENAIRAYDYDAHVYREQGPCDGRVADGRAVAVRRSEDGKGLAFLGRSDGGDDMFYCQSRDVLRETSRLAFDDYTSAYNMQAQAITYAAKMDSETL